jgi:hypothetical protein
MIIEMIYYSTFWLNSFPPADRVSETISPRAIVAGMLLDYVKHCKLEFGTYVQTHEEHTNIMATRITGAIALRPTGNEQGGYYFLSLTTGRRLNRNCWTALPMPADVNDRVHTLARRSNASRGLTFADCSGDPFLDHGDDHSTDESYNPNNNPDHEDDDSTSDDDDNNYADLPNAADAINIPIEGVNRQELNENINHNEDANNQEDDNDDPTDEEDGNDEATSEEDGNEAVTNKEDGNTADYINEENGNEAATNIDDGNEADYVGQANTEDAMIEKYGECSRAHNLRTRRPGDIRCLRAP